MARAPLSEFFAVNAVGLATHRLRTVEGATIEIQNRSDSSPVTVYDAAVGGSPIATVLTDAAGIPPGYVDRPGEYKALISKTGEIDDYTQEFDAPPSANDVELVSNKGVANGYASLDASGRLPVSQLSLDAVEYKGAWNASTNTPALADGVGNTGDFYTVSVGASRNLGSGAIDFQVNDKVIYNGATWEKIDTSDTVSSVNGFTGAVVLGAGDVGAQPADADLTTLASIGMDNILPWRHTIIPTMGSIMVQGTAGLVGDTTAYLGGAVFNTSGAQNDEMAWDILLSAGTWSFAYMSQKNANVAIATLRLDGSTIGTFDCYNATKTWNNQFAATGIAVATGGKHRLSAKAATRNASNTTGWFLVPQMIVAWRTA